MKKLAVHHLEIGMEVVKLDRKWLETPFVKHNFVIESKKQLAQLSKFCNYVYINNSDNLALTNKNIKSPCDNQEQCKTALSTSYKLLNNALNDFQENSYICAQKIKKIVNFLTIQVLNNSATYEYLNTIQSNSPNIAHKSLRVLVIYLTFCKYLGIKKSKLLNLGCAAVLHDIGMLKIPVAFDKAVKFTATERVHITKHSTLGETLVRENQDFSPVVAQVIKSHHEYYNGSGYPAGLSGRDINLYSRMLTLVCTYEAITRNRGYKNALNSYSAITELARVSGSMLDPRLVGRFIEMVGEYPVGTRIRTQNNEIVQVLAKIEKDTYQVTPTSAEGYDRINLLETSSFAGVIYE